MFLSRENYLTECTYSLFLTESIYGKDKESKNNVTIKVGSITCSKLTQLLVGKRQYATVLPSRDRPRTGDSNQET